LGQRKFKFCMIEVASFVITVAFSFLFAQGTWNFSTSHVRAAERGHRQALHRERERF
jgi:hypothetical protein